MEPEATKEPMDVKVSEATKELKLDGIEKEPKTPRQSSRKPSASKSSEKLEIIKESEDSKEPEVTKKPELSKKPEAAKEPETPLRRSRRTSGSNTTQKSEAITQPLPTPLKTPGKPR